MTDSVRVADRFDATISLRPPKAPRASSLARRQRVTNSVVKSARFFAKVD